MLYRRAAAFLLLAVCLPTYAAVAVDQLVEAHDIVCEFYNVDDWATAEARFVMRDRSDLLMVIANIKRDPNSARVVSSGIPGARHLQRYDGDTGVHFVEDREESVVVTTLLACEDWKIKKGREVCARYSAVNAWHFDTSVHQDADKAFRKLSGSSYRGVCEPWNPE
jgi:hypothetical protein